MKNILPAILLLITSVAFAQTKTTTDLSDKYSSWTLFLYHNTLRMINQTNDKDFDDLIKDIEKMKLVSVNKKEKNFSDAQYKTLLTSYKSEKFEEIMTTRHEGKSFNAYIKDEDGETKGMVVTVNDTETVYVMDIVGKVDLSKIISLFSKLDKNSELNDQIKQVLKNKMN